MELFPVASEQDFQAAKSLLHRYQRMRNTVLKLERKKWLSEKEQQVFDEYKQKTEAVEMGVSLILDDNVRRVMEFRFIRGNPRWGTVTRFSNITDRSVDRRIVRGIESVADTLKLIDII